jgi:hypothetical protein
MPERFDFFDYTIGPFGFDRPLLTVIVPPNRWPPRKGSYVALQYFCGGINTKMGVP